jgi:hypothetical protein
MILCFAMKGGSGTTVVSCALAIALSPSVLVDLGGDAPTALGVASPSGPGIAEWMRSPTSTPASLAPLAIAAGNSTSVLPRGDDTIPDGQFPRLVDALRQFTAPIVVDGGTGRPHPSLAAAADHVVLVTRPCFLALRRATESGVAIDSVVLVSEPGRALRARDVEGAVGAPVVADVQVDPLVARAVDAGMLATRLPRQLTQAMRRVAA